MAEPSSLLSNSLSLKTNASALIRFFFFSGGLLFLIWRSIARFTVRQTFSSRKATFLSVLLRFIMYKDSMKTRNITSGGGLQRRGDTTTNPAERHA
jgi:hypothetical protein